MCRQEHQLVRVLIRVLSLSLRNTDESYGNCDFGSINVKFLCTVEYGNVCVCVQTLIIFSTLLYFARMEHLALYSKIT